MKRTHKLNKAMLVMYEHRKDYSVVWLSWSRASHPLVLHLLNRELDRLERRIRLLQREIIKLDKELSYDKKTAKSNKRFCGGNPQFTPAIVAVF